MILIKLFHDQNVCAAPVNGAVFFVQGRTYYGILGS
jgi:hypothetical protein